MVFTQLQTAALLFAVSFAGALLPLYRRWSDRGLHIFVSISAGIFLGTIFLHLLPHLAGAGIEDEAHESFPHAEATLAPWIAALAGLLLLFFIEKVWLKGVTAASGADPHSGLWVATYVGLGLHSLTAGIALTPVLAEPGVRNQFLASLLIHKATETFSLATVMRLANLGNARAISFLCLFAALEPVGLLLGGQLSSSGHEIELVLTGFACGTFLYVAVCDLLPEVFHGIDRPILKIAAVCLGILSTAITLPRVVWASDFAALIGAESATVFLDLAPYLLLGFLIAGILRQLIRPEWLVRHVSGDDLKSVTIASLLGAPLPLCSCAVVPVAVSMRRSGASKGATTAFLIATPETGVDSVTVSWALLDPFLTIARPVGAILSAIFSGAAVNWFVRRGLDRPRGPTSEQAAESAAACCDHDPTPSNAEAQTAALAPARDELATPAAGQPGTRIARVLRYAFVEMLDDLAPSLVVSVLLSGLIMAALPTDVFQSPLAHGFPGLVLMLVIGIPVYVCATASTPIAAALILKGLSPGAAFVFLLAGPATNLGSMFVLSRHLGRRVILVQLVSLALVTLALGSLVDFLYRALDIAPSAELGAAPELSAWVTIPCAIALGGLLVVSIARTSLGRWSLQSRRSAARVEPVLREPGSSEGSLG